MVAVRLSRSQIAAFVGNDPEAIRQIEKLVLQSNGVESDLTSIGDAAGIAIAAAAEASAAVQRLQDILDRAPVQAFTVPEINAAPAVELAALMRTIEDLQAAPVPQVHTS